MDEFWDWLQNTYLASEIGATWLFPLIESIHVVAIVLVLGSILMVDLRLLGIAARVYAVGALTRELTRWTWGGFAVAVVSGLLLFITRPGAYAINPAFQAKMALLILAGVNVTVLHTGAMRRITKWEQADLIPVSARLAGGVSMLLWAGVALAGRWTGHLQ